MVAGIVAASEKTGGYTVLFVIAGVGAGWGCAMGVRILAYSILFAATRLSRSWNWLGWLLLMAYMFAPMIAMMGCWFVVGGLSRFVAHAIFQ